MSKKFRGVALILRIQQPSSKCEDPEEISALHHMWQALHFRVAERSDWKELTAKVYSLIV